MCQIEDDFASGRRRHRTAKGNLDNTRDDKLVSEITETLGEETSDYGCRRVPTRVAWFVFSGLACWGALGECCSEGGSWNDSSRGA